MDTQTERGEKCKCVRCGQVEACSTLRCPNYHKCQALECQSLVLLFLCVCDVLIVIHQKVNLNEERWRKWNLFVNKVVCACSKLSAETLDCESPEARTIEGTILQGCLMLFACSKLFGILWIPLVSWLPELRMGCMERVGSLLQVRWSTSKPQLAPAAQHICSDMLDITRSYLEDVGTKNSVPTTHIVSSSFVTFFQWLQSV